MTQGVLTKPRRRERKAKVQLPTEPQHSNGAAVAVDLIEKILAVVFYSWMLWGFLANFLETGNWASPILVVSNGLIVFFILFRRPPRELSLNLGAWLLALGGTFIPMLVTVEGDALGSIVVGEMTMLTGVLVQIAAKIALGRSFGLLPAHRGLSIAGPYRFVRHPMYAGYLIANLGFLYLHPTLWNLAVYIVAYSMQIPRLLYEERVLSRDESYREYQAKVRYHLIPGVF
jgi:protein-S-isoprenylcysteine O-methyltransferase Ste14